MLTSNVLENRKVLHLKWVVRTTIDEAWVQEHKDRDAVDRSAHSLR